MTLMKVAVALLCLALCGALELQKNASAASGKRDPHVPTKSEASDVLRVELGRLVKLVAVDGLPHGYDAKAALVSAERIVELLRKDAASASTTSEAPAKNASVHLHAQKSRTVGTCLFDDRLFGLSETSKQELAWELDQASMLEAVGWVQTGGTVVCAAENEVCACQGLVTMVDVDRTVWSTSVDAVATGNLLVCNAATFGGVDLKPGFQKLCECKQSGAHYSMYRRMSSWSYLQEAWVFLLRLLGRNFMLPLGTGDKTYHGIENWAARRLPGTAPLVLEHVWIRKYMKDIVQTSTTGMARCLEWGDPTRPGYGFNYLHMLPQCTDKVDIQYDPIFRGERAPGLVGNIAYSDINNLPAVLTQGGDFRVSLIAATQVMEHLAHPEYAMKMLFASLLEGGALIITAPQQAQFHLVPHDFFRYTKEGVLQLLVDAGFCVPAWGFAGGGDFVFDIARDAGLLVQDFTTEELGAAFQVGYDLVSHAAITIHASAFKPPHEACSVAMKALG